MANLLDAVRIEQAADVYGGMSDGDDVSYLTTWQLQQMRRAASIRRRLPWRESVIEAECALRETYRELAQRGAIVTSDDFEDR